MDSDLTEEFLNRVKETYTVDELCELLNLDIDQFIDLTWDMLVENEFLQKHLGIRQDYE